METAPVSAVTTKAPAFVDKTTGGGNFTEHLEAHAGERPAPAGNADDRRATRRDHGDATQRTDPAETDFDTDTARAAPGAADDATPAETEPRDEIAGDDVPAAETATAPAEDGAHPGDDPVGPATATAATAGSGVPAPASSVASAPAAGADTTNSAAAPAVDGANDPTTVSRAIPATPAVPGQGGEAATPAVPGQGGEAATPAVAATPATPAQHSHAHSQGDAHNAGPATPVAPGTPAVPATPAIPTTPHSVAAEKSASPGRTSAINPAVPATPAIPVTLEGPATPATPASAALAAQSAQAADGSATAFDHGSSSGNDTGGWSGREPQTAAEAFGKGVLPAGRAAPSMITAPAASQADLHPAPSAIDIARVPSSDSGQALMALQGASDGDAPAPTGYGNQPSVGAAFGSEIRVAGNAAAAAQASYNGRAEVPPAAQQVAVQITRAVQNGTDRFTVELKPGALGRVTVNLEIGYDNRVIAVLSAERADTLELLQRDSRALERALQDAGLSTDSGSLSFSLEGGNGDDDEPFGPAGTGADFFAHDADGDGSATLAGYAQYIGNDAIDIRV